MLNRIRGLSSSVSTSTTPIITPVQITTTTVPIDVSPITSLFTTEQSTPTLAPVQPTTSVSIIATENSNSDTYTVSAVNELLLQEEQGYFSTFWETALQYGIT